MGERFTFRDIEKVILEPCCTEYANIAYDSTDDNVIVFTCNSGGKYLKADNTQRFLRALLCKGIYDSLFGITETDDTPNHRSSFFKGKKPSKSHAISTENLVKNANERLEPLCNEQLHRIQCLLETTALIQTMDIDKDKTKLKISKLKQEAPEEVYSRNLKGLRKKLAEDINKSKIKNSISIIATDNNIEEALAQVVLLATFQNDYVNYKEAVETLIVEKIRALFRDEKTIDDKTQDVVGGKYSEEIERYRKLSENGRKYFEEGNYELAEKNFINYQKEAEALYNVTRDNEILSDVIHACKNIICVLMVLNKTESAIKKYKKILKYMLRPYEVHKEFLDFYNEVLSKVKEGGPIRLCTNNAMYQGEIRNSLFHGYGTYYSLNGGMYIGEYQEGKRNGLGVYFFPDYVYCGGWKNDQYDGEATWISKEGAVWTAKYNEGVEIQ